MSTTQRMPSRAKDGKFLPSAKGKPIPSVPYKRYWRKSSHDPNKIDDLFMWFMYAPYDELVNVVRGCMRVRALRDLGAESDGFALIIEKTVSNSDIEKNKDKVHPRCHNVIALRTPKVKVYNASTNAYEHVYSRESRESYSNQNQMQYRLEQAEFSGIPFDVVADVMGDPNCIFDMSLVERRCPENRVGARTGTFRDEIYVNHFSGALLLKFGHGANSRTFLMDVDRNEVRLGGMNPFFSEVKGNPRSIVEAYDNLRPVGVGNDETSVRQGEFFFSNKAYGSIELAKILSDRGTPVVHPHTLSTSNLKKLEEIMSAIWALADRRNHLMLAAITVCDVNDVIKKAGLDRYISMLKAGDVTKLEKDLFWSVWPNLDRKSEASSLLADMQRKYSVIGQAPLDVSYCPVIRLSGYREMLLGPNTSDFHVQDLVSRIRSCMREVDDAINSIAQNHVDAERIVECWRAIGPVIRFDKVYECVFGKPCFNVYAPSVVTSLSTGGSFAYTFARPYARFGGPSMGPVHHMLASMVTKDRFPEMSRSQLAALATLAAHGTPRDIETLLTSNDNEYSTDPFLNPSIDPMYKPTFCKKSDVIDALRSTLENVSREEVSDATAIERVRTMLRPYTCRTRTDMYDRKEAEKQIAKTVNHVYYGVYRLPNARIANSRHLASDVLVTPGRNGSVWFDPEVPYNEIPKMNPRMFVRGCVWHESREHMPLYFNNWHEVFLNNTDVNHNIYGRVD